MEELGSAEETSSINQSFADQIREIVETAGRNGTWVPGTSMSRDFFGELHKINLNAYHEREELSNEYGEEIHNLLPENVGYPLYTFQDLPADAQSEIIETPYGRQPGIVVGADGNIYHFSNQYFFDDLGNAFRYEHVYTGVDENSKDSISKLDSFPKEEDSLFVPINPIEDSGVYEKVGALLKQVIEGEFKLSRFRVAPGY